MKLFFIYFFSLFIIFSCAENNGDFKNTSKLPDLTPASSAKYTVTFESNWNATNFPTDFPSSPSFGKTILITNNTKGFLFKAEKTSTNAFYDFILNNNFLLLENELNTQQTNLNLNWFDLGLMNTTEINPPFNLAINSKTPMVSLCMKINPSPNWFLGISNFSLLENDGQWTNRAVVSLIAYDTDGTTQQSTTYNSTYNANPAGLITKINPTVLTPSTKGTEIGKFIFTKN